jgi:hypothetical protein
MTGNPFRPSDKLEKKMTNSGRIVLIVAVLAALTACAKKEAPPENPVTIEPTYTGKL